MHENNRRFVASAGSDEIFPLSSHFVVKACNIRIKKGNIIQKLRIIIVKFITPLG